MPCFKYVRVLNILLLSICQGTEFSGLHKVYIFHKYFRVLEMRQDAFMEELWILQDFKYASFCICKLYTRFWICLNVAQGFECSSASKHASAWIMAKLWIWEGHTGCWICLYKPEYTLIMLNMLDYACTFLNKQSSEYAKNLNVSDAERSKRFL